jgi:antitoxin (DNA-binding transcriptional repressor) of toxin-antitoxin stability system
MKTIGVRELTEHINEILRLVKEEGETIEVIDHGEIIAHLVPTHISEERIKKDRTAWENLNRIASELEPYWPKGVDAVEIVRDVRRDL